MKATPEMAWPTPARLSTISAHHRCVCHRSHCKLRLSSQYYHRRIIHLPMSSSIPSFSIIWQIGNQRLILPRFRLCPLPLPILKSTTKYTPKTRSWAAGDSLMLIAEALSFFSACKEECERAATDSHRSLVGSIHARALSNVVYPKRRLGLEPPAYCGFCCVLLCSPS